MVRRPTTWALVLLVAIGIAFPTLLWQVSKSMNAAARSASLALAEGAISSLAEADGLTTSSLAHADDTIHGLSGVVNSDWAENHLGLPLGRGFQIDGSVVVDARDELAFAWINPDAIRSPEPAGLISALHDVVGLARADQSGAVWQDYIEIDHNVFLGSAARVQQKDSPGTDAAKILVLLRALGPSLVSQVGSDYSVRELHVVEADEPVGSREVSLTLRSVEGAPAATIAWHLEWPGDRLVWHFGVPAVVIIAALAVLLLLSLHRTQRGARMLAATNHELREREAEAHAARLRAERADQAKTSFLANMSHELRTPLTAVIGFCELLETRLYGPVNSKQAEYLKDIRVSGQHLLGIINDILDMARLDAGQYRIEPECLDLANVVEECFRLIKGRAEEAEIALISGVSATMPELFADRRAVKQVLINLMGNAVKFTPRSGTVRADARINADGSCTLGIEDTGAGIPSEILERLFQPFQQGDNTLTRRHEGAGLGLSISRELMALHGGTLEIQSAPGRGTRALAHFPAQRVIAEPARGVLARPPNVVVRSERADTVIDSM